VLIAGIFYPRAMLIAGIFNPSSQWTVNTVNLKPHLVNGKQKVSSCSTLNQVQNNTQ
jgi:hypothetical protein